MMKIFLQISVVLSMCGCSSGVFNSGGSKNTSAPVEQADFNPEVGEPGRATGDDFGDGRDIEPPPDLNNLFSGDGDGKVVTFAMLVNDFKCGACHTTVRGSIVSVNSVPGVWETSNLVVEGDWYISGELNYGAGSAGRFLETRGVLYENYTGSKLPQDEDGDGNPDFPKFDPSKIKSKMHGTVKTKDVIISKISSDNTVLIGTNEDPIEINGEVLIEGDLIIKGRYKGVGNIYATGRIYIPGDILATKSAFPFDDDPLKAREEAKLRMAKTYDALGLASKIAIIISEFDSYGGMTSVFEHPETPANYNSTALGMRNVYQWYPEGKVGYDQIMDPGPQPCPSDRVRPTHTFSRIDAFLYAEVAIGGRAGFNSYAINGGVMTDHYHIIAGAQKCTPGIHPIHGYQRNRNHINFDWRYVHGLQILKQLGYYFDNSTE